MKNGLYEKVLGLATQESLTTKTHKQIRNIDNTEVSKVLFQAAHFLQVIQELL